MFFSNNFLTSAALIALAIDCSLAATLPSKRQTPATCSTSNTGYLTLSPLRAASPVTYAGIVSGVTHTGIDGNTVSTNTSFSCSLFADLLLDEGLFDRDKRH
jgi:hypothetical protein